MGFCANTRTLLQLPQTKIHWKALPIFELLSQMQQRHHVNNVNMGRAPEAPQETTMPSAVPSSKNAENGEMPSDVTTMATSMTYVTAPEAIASSSVVMMTTEVVLSGPNGLQMVGRALLDPASTASFIAERAAQHSKLQREKHEISVSGIGGTQCFTQCHAIVNDNLKSIQNSLHSVEEIVLPSLTKRLPITSLPKGDWPHLSALKLADLEFNVSKPIDVLLGVDVYHSILKPGLILGPKGCPAAQETIYGWVLFGGASGQEPPNEVATLYASTLLPSCEETLQKFWTLEEPPKARLPLAPLDKLSVQDFDQCQKRDETGRFVVRLPFKPQSSSLGEFRPQALRRFLSLERRLHQTNQFDDYAKVVTEYFTSGHAERVPDADLNKPASNAFYLAHHGLQKFSYNASACHV